MLFEIIFTTFVVFIFNDQNSIVKQTNDFVKQKATTTFEFNKTNEQYIIIKSKKYNSIYNVL